MMFRRKKTQVVEYRLQIFIKHKRQPIAVMLEKQKQVDEFYALLKVNVNNSDFFQFGQFLFNRNAIEYAFYEEIVKKS